MAILAGVGPWGSGAIDYALHYGRRRLRHHRYRRSAPSARALYTVEEAGRFDVGYYVNTRERTEKLMAFGRQYNDVLVMAPVRSVIEQDDNISVDGCLNFFADPPTEFLSQLQLHNVHYSSRIVGTSAATMTTCESLVDEQGHINDIHDHPWTTWTAWWSHTAPPGIPGDRADSHLIPLTAIDDFQAGRKDPSSRPGGHRQKRRLL